MRKLAPLGALLAASLAACAAPAHAPAPAGDPLRIFFMDVEGGQATLLVSPSGESMLVDTGWPGTRDAGRIIAAAREAGVDTLDHLVITHYHDDHVGGMEELVKTMPVRRVYSHGAPSPNDRMAVGMIPSYRTAMADAGLAAERILEPGDVIPVAGLEVQVLTSDRQLLATPLPGAGSPNPLCAGVTPRRTDSSDNSASVGMLITFGDFRFLDIGDVTQDLEYQLACPVNRFGDVDLYLTTHHGAGSSNAEVLVHALSPRVAIMNNGARKGGDPVVIDVVKRSPDLEDFWMLHFSEAAGRAGNVEAEKIANLTDAATATGDDAGYGIRVSAYPDGTFTVTNERNGLTRVYPAR